MKVRDVMTHDVKCCFEGDSLALAAELMWDHDCGCVPVTRKDGLLVGLLTDRDLLVAALMSGKALHELRARDAMSRNVATCKSNDRVGMVQTLMRRRRVRRLPVTDTEGRVVGLLSLQDLARTATQSRTWPFPRVRMKEIAQTFAAVSKPEPRPAPAIVRTSVAVAE